MGAVPQIVAWMAAAKSLHALFNPGEGGSKLLPFEEFVQICKTNYCAGKFQNITLMGAALQIVARIAAL